MLRRKFFKLFAVALIGVAFIGGKSVYAISGQSKCSNNNTNLYQSLKKDGNKNQKVTILYYCDADNNLEENLMNDLAEMKRGYVNDPNLNLIALVDRRPDFS